MASDPLQAAQALSAFLPSERIITDEMTRFALGTDASFYRLVPKLVVKVENEDETGRVMRACRSLEMPFTFRAAGTSLSGQALSDSVLIVLGRGWDRIQVSGEGARITLGPGVLGYQANLALEPYGRKIGPDPASINAAMIGGIAANNASGMCCRVAQNSYHTLESLRVLLADGYVLDTADASSRERFLTARPDIPRRLLKLREKVLARPELAARIRAKYKMKNTTGYSLNALVDFDDPVEILQHLMIGSEGTLGFIAEITYRTVAEPPFRAASLVVFPDVAGACRALSALPAGQVQAAELMDRASLRSVESKKGMPDFLRQLPEKSAALLLEIRGVSTEELDRACEETVRSLKPFIKEAPSFTRDPEACAALWNIRKGLFPSVGAMRESGTTVIIEDVCFPVERLAEAASALEELLQTHGYMDAIVFGHALEGNLHFVFKQDFNKAAEVRRYGDFMDALTKLVVQRFDGALKAEHGTGRNMAPFVQREWGAEAYDLMKEIKEIFDPENLLNPGVILNPDPRAHLKDLKPLPVAHEAVDKCTECGFCERHCPSRDLTLTPRQRIAVYREVKRLEKTGENPRRLREFSRAFSYAGEKTCAADGLCSLSCPVGIDTGKLVKSLRAENHSWAGRLAAAWAARHMAGAAAAGRFVLGAAGKFLPSSFSWLPRPAKPLVRRTNMRDPVVYFPSCASRVFGAYRGASESPDLIRRTESLLDKAGYDAFYPEGADGLCCGLAFASKGFENLAREKAAELAAALEAASAGGQLPILFDTTPCLQRLRDFQNSAGNPGQKKLPLHDIAEFARLYLKPRLHFSPVHETAALHLTCSSLKMGLDAAQKEAAGWCVEKLVLPETGCCGVAGDKGFFVPEISRSALRGLKEKLGGAANGYATSRTCEMGLTRHSGIFYESLAVLLDKASSPAKSGSGKRKKQHA